MTTVSAREMTEKGLVSLSNIMAESLGAAQSVGTQFTGKIAGTARQTNDSWTLMYIMQRNQYFPKQPHQHSFISHFSSLGRGQERGNPDRGTQGGDPEG